MRQPVARDCPMRCWMARFSASRGREARNVGVRASAGVRGVLDLVGVLGVHDEQPVEGGDLAHRGLDLDRGQRGELVDAGVQQEALEPEDAGLVQRPQVRDVAGHGAAPEPDVHPRLAVGALRLTSSAATSTVGGMLLSGMSTMVVTPPAPQPPWSPSRSLPTRCVPGR